MTGANGERAKRSARQIRPGEEKKRVDEKPEGSGMRMARSMADKQAVEQLKNASAVLWGNGYIMD
ncbi:hypothetical protein OHD62_30250 [Mesorhizobium sp. YC-39]|uniref:hypothetical protein n=1 Tax=unclassified Mesorhizobium TaxID=325217 RepID=UPI0021E860F3|nr:MULTISPECIES: hypothetical protein [unclassified Mesorhizobium]MCV3210424.1 hypothetical protein [Mesorhizobium sp. YC-2]MCV3232678.1 hypothetical protein [Mesorhizobium sp. YC-39]